VEWRYKSVLDGGEWSASRPDLFILGKNAACTYEIANWVGHGADKDALKTRKKSLHRPGIEP
jgi:hypothetical protein